VVVDYRKQDVWSIGVTLHKMIYGRKPTLDSLEFLTSFDSNNNDNHVHHHHHHQHNQHHQRHARQHYGGGGGDEGEEEEEDRWTTAALDILVRGMLQPRPHERFSASFALLVLRFTLFGPKQRPMWRTPEHWVAWLRERRRLRPHPFYGECMARGLTSLKKSVGGTTSTTAGGEGGGGGGEEEEEEEGSDDYVLRYLEWQHTQFVWTATPAALLSVVSFFEPSS
jgi:hypothetical protein